MVVIHPPGFQVRLVFPYTKHIVQVVDKGIIPHHIPVFFRRVHVKEQKSAGLQSITGAEDEVFDGLMSFR